MSTAPSRTPTSPPALLERVLAAAEPYEFRTFVVGFPRPDEYSRAEHEARFRAVKIALGDSLLERWPGRDVDFLSPEVRFDLRADGSLALQIAPLFLAGRYRKLSREIPATRWIHHRCRGRGCELCGWSGNLCGPSVQELLAAPVLRAAGGTGTLLHTLGREDTDVRTLGAGRPFVLEVTRPLRRTLDLELLAREFADGSRGLAEVSRLSRVGLAEAKLVKAVAAEKTYRAVVVAAGSIPEGAAARVASLSGALLRQLSPTRVADRRGRGVLRERRVIRAEWLGPIANPGGGEHLFEVRAEAGTYIKELISGDGGRTVPSLSSILGVECRCAALDVIEIHWDPPWERAAEESVG